MFGVSRGPKTWRQLSSTLAIHGKADALQTFVTHTDYDKSFPFAELINEITDSKENL